MNAKPQTLLQGKPWTPSGQTDVRETWKKFGWQPTRPAAPAGNDAAYKQKGS